MKFFLTFQFLIICLLLQVAKMSMQSGVVSEYTRMVLLETVQIQEKHASTSSGVKKVGH